MTLLSPEKPVRPRRPRARRRPAGPLTAVRVFRGPRFLGQLLLTTDGRLWRRGPEVPGDVALKILAMFSHFEVREGEICGRKDGRIYSWSAPGAGGVGEDTLAEAG